MGYVDIPAVGTLVGRLSSATNRGEAIVDGGLGR
jgi:hypothetical protein